MRRSARTYCSCGQRGGPGTSVWRHHHDRLTVPIEARIGTPAARRQSSDGPPRWPIPPTWLFSSWVREAERKRRRSPIAAARVVNISGSTGVVPHGAVCRYRARNRVSELLPGSRASAGLLGWAVASGRRGGGVGRKMPPPATLHAVATVSMPSGGATPGRVEVRWGATRDGSARRSAWCASEATPADPCGSPIPRTSW